jgi:hypothetical protein
VQKAAAFTLRLFSIYPERRQACPVAVEGPLTWFFLPPPSSFDSASLAQGDVLQAAASPPGKAQDDILKYALFSPGPPGMMSAL